MKALDRISQAGGKYLALAIKWREEAARYGITALGRQQARQYMRLNAQQWRRTAAAAQPVSS